MQWFIDLIKDWVIAQGYALQSWVLERLCTSTIRVYRSGSQVIPSITWTKILFNAESWDVNNEFANYKFTAKEAGYFQVNLAALMADIAGDKRVDVAIKKNGNWHSVTQERTGGAGYNGSYLPDVVHLNGTTDYIEGFVYHNDTGAKNLHGTGAYTFMSIHQLSKDSWL